MSTIAVVFHSGMGHTKSAYQKDHGRSTECRVMSEEC